jgi:hypothetical protein
LKVPTILTTVVKDRCGNCSSSLLADRSTRKL